MGFSEEKGEKIYIESNKNKKKHNRKNWFDTETEETN